ncbi:MAG: single-stranded DNA-binding protein [Syntrophomonadaceae bacterium]|jgi:single-strand DNA-binding protein|nr:single-stranded DNA-binding protein [Bacillota bacterium]NLM87330.1 single-stranded DNA-binding protein [Syntrophomonadaceae bacterium]HAA08288.1 single-stranded DNA-binding protein [Syntrophomonas sp.]HQA50690.1 single-stranded DNA-binding protein [Syntrophomonadaceae bacterium]HQD90964.1 single-stranded DNA-binding protein [Syntrophomonadaceae bacterium]
MLNRVILIGRLTHDPELRYTQNGTAVCRFTLAVNRRYNREQADFIDIVTWRGLAENCANYLGKGRLAAVEGSIQVRTYETQEGQKRKVTEVIADDVRFLDRGGTGGSAAKASFPSKPQQDQWDDLGTEVSLDDIDFVDSTEDDEIPF